MANVAYLPSKHFEITKPKITKILLGNLDTLVQTRIRVKICVSLRYLLVM